MVLKIHADESKAHRETLKYLWGWGQRIIMPISRYSGANNFRLLRVAEREPWEKHRKKKMRKANFQRGIKKLAVTLQIALQNYLFAFLIKKAKDNISALDKNSIFLIIHS